MRRLVLAEGALVEGELALPQQASHYLRDVLRVDPSVELELTDGAGRVALAKVARVDKRAVVLSVGPLRIVPRTGRSLTLIQCIAKGEKMDQIVRQTTELGVARIIPVVSERAVPRGHRRPDRWRQIADDAVRVSHRAWRPEIRPVAALADVLAEPRADRALVFALDGARTLAEALGDDRPALQRMTRPSVEPSSIEVLVGPEGGLTAVEIERAKEAGFVPVALGPHTFRTETAAAAVVTLILLGS